MSEVTLGDTLDGTTLSGGIAASNKITMRY